MNTGFRQGDVLIIPTDSIPVAAKAAKPEKGRLIVARGEATGHHHSFPHARGATLFRDDGTGSMWVEATAPVALEHQEHHALTLAPGKYRVVIQRIYQAGTYQQVKD